MIPVDFRVGLVQRRQIGAFLLRHFVYPDNALAREEQLFRVQVSGLGKPPRLLCTSARVGGVHEAALVLPERMQIPSRSGQLLPKSVSPDLEQFRTTDIGDAEDRSEDVDESLFAIEA